MRIETLKRNFNIDVKLVHFPLHPETPVEGRSMAELYAGRDVDPDAMYARMKGLMDQEGLPYGKRTHTYNSRLTQEIGKWADTIEGGEALNIVVAPISRAASFRRTKSRVPSVLVTAPARVRVNSNSANFFPTTAPIAVAARPTRARDEPTARPTPWLT